MPIQRLVGAIVGFLGGGLALWGVVTFAVVGRGSPLPFTPPSRLVIRGSYRFVRNPMAIGVALVLTGVAIVYSSIGLLIFTAGFLLFIHVIVVGYEERHSARRSVRSTRPTPGGSDGGGHGGSAIRGESEFGLHWRNHI